MSKAVIDPKARIEKKIAALIGEKIPNIIIRRIFWELNITSVEAFLALDHATISQARGIGPLNAAHVTEMQDRVRAALKGEFTLATQGKVERGRRAIRVEGTDLTLELSKVTAVKTKQRMIHLDELPDGTWRLIYNGDHIPDFTKVVALTVIREDDRDDSNDSPKQALRAEFDKGRAKVGLPPSTDMEFAIALNEFKKWAGNR